MKSIKLPLWTERLLGIDPRPAPPHAFTLDGQRLTYAAIQRQGGGYRLERRVAAELPAGCFQSGLLGGPLRDPEVLGHALRQVLAEVEGPVAEASLVLPDAWLRVAFSEVAELPRDAAARDQVLRWKLKRLVPFRVEELRVEGVEVPPLNQQQEPRRLMLGFALESLLDQVESQFQAAGVRLGRIVNASLSLLAALDASGDELYALALIEPPGYALVFARGGRPLLHRYKASSSTAMDPAAARLVTRDLKLTRSFLEESFPAARLAGSLLAAPPELEGLWQDWLEEGLGAPVEALQGRHLPALEQTADAVLPWFEVAPLLGAVHQEVR